MSANGTVSQDWQLGAERAYPAGRITPECPVTRAAVRHGDRAALAYQFVTCVPKPNGTTKKNRGSFAPGRFSFERYLQFTRVSKGPDRRYVRRVLTASSWKS